MAAPRPNRFSSRLSWDLDPNPLTLALQAHRASGRPLVDLTETNPTRVGLPCDTAILAGLAGPAAMAYEPDPRGLPAARAAVAAYYRDHHRAVDPDRILLTASTSEAYALVLKLLADPGDEALIPRPCYPLFEPLISLENLRARSYALSYSDDRGWRIDWETLAAAAGPRTRVVAAVSPNNPTGSYLRAEDRARLSSFCAERGLALIVDEVFLDYPASGFEGLVSSAAANPGALTFVLSGLSKVAALPQLKLGWIQVGGPPEAANEARDRLEFLTDTYLSVNAPAQHAAAGILAGRAAVQAAIRERLDRNAASLAEACSAVDGFRPLNREGGWYGVIAMPPDRDEEATVLRLLEREGVWVHPGHFYDFDEASLVVSLLPPPEVFTEGMSRLAAG